MNGEEVKKILSSRGFSQQQVADLLGKSRANLNGMLGKEDIKTGLLEEIVRVTGIPMSAFYPELGDAPQDMGEVSKILAKKDEQIDRLLTILEKMSDSIPTQIGCKPEEKPGNA